MTGVHVSPPAGSVTGPVPGTDAVSDPPRRVLLISYIFPPAPFVGVFRILKYCKFLERHGWRPVVLTVPYTGTPQLEERLCREVPACVKVVRTWDVDPARWLRQRRARRSPNPGPPKPSGGQPPPGERGPLQRIKTPLLRLVLWSPDSHIFWVPFAVVRGALLLRRTPADVIFSSSPPHSSHLAAAILSKLFSTPYVLDFRDPWTAWGPLARLMGRLKRSVVFGAARVMTASPGERDELLKEYPTLDPRRVVAITNGYDPDDFASVVPAERDASTVVVSHVGTVYPGAGLELFEALTLLVEERPSIREWLRVTLVGTVDEAYDDVVARLKSEGILQTIPFLPHSAAMAQVAASDVLLILLGGDGFAPSELPAKLSEYLYADKRILAVAKRGELWEVLAQSGCGVAVPPRDPRALAAALWETCVAARFHADRPARDRNYIRRFDRRALVADLARVLNEVVESGTSVGARELGAAK